MLTDTKSQSHTFGTRDRVRWKDRGRSGKTGSNTRVGSSVRVKKGGEVGHMFSVELGDLRACGFWGDYFDFVCACACEIGKSVV